MTYLFFHLKKGADEPSVEAVKAKNVWEASRRFRILYQYSIVKSIRVKGGK